MNGITVITIEYCIKRSKILLKRQKIKNEGMVNEMRERK